MSPVTLLSFSTVLRVVAPKAVWLALSQKVMPSEVQSHIRDDVERQEKNRRAKARYALGKPWIHPDDPRDPMVVAFTASTMGRDPGEIIHYFSRYAGLGPYGEYPYRSLIRFDRLFHNLPKRELERLAYFDDASEAGAAMAMVEANGDNPHPPGTLAYLAYQYLHGSPYPIRDMGAELP
jgi:hypothetical protein